MRQTAGNAPKIYHYPLANLGWLGVSLRVELVPRLSMAMDRKPILNIKIYVNVGKLLLPRPRVVDCSLGAASGTTTQALLNLDFGLAAHEVDTRLGHEDIGAGGDAGSPH